MRVLLYHTSCAHCHGTHGAGWLAGDSDCFARSVYTGYALWHSTRTLGKNNCHLRQTAAAYAAGGGTDWTQRFVGCADYRAVHRKHTGAARAWHQRHTGISRGKITAARGKTRRAGCGKQRCARGLRAQYCGAAQSQAVLLHANAAGCAANQTALSRRGYEQDTGNSGVGAGGETNTADFLLA